MTAAQYAQISDELRLLVIGVYALVGMIGMSVIFGFRIRK